MLSPRGVPFDAALLIVVVAAIFLAVDAADAARGTETLASSFLQDRHNAARGKQQRQSQLASSFLGPHNAVRRAVGLRPLAWDEGLAAYARGYAAARARTGCALVHSHGPFGENLFRGSGVGWKPAEMVAAWVVRERAMYDRGSNTCRGAATRGACGHYTQIVWRSTTKVGCAMATCADGRGTFGVCTYNPPGNYFGVRPY